MTRGQFRDLRGQVFGKWVVLERGPTRVTERSANTRWWCLCTCCREEFLVFMSNLTGDQSHACFPCGHNWCDIRRSG